MIGDSYEYQFDTRVDIDEVEAVLVRAVAAAAALHGESAVRLNARHSLNRVSLTCRVDSHDDVGEHLNKLFVAFLVQEFGADAFQVQRTRLELSA